MRNRKQKTLYLLKKLVDETRKMSKEEFAKREHKLGIDKIYYDPKDYEEVKNDN
jgi:hypothetical protein